MHKEIINNIKDEALVELDIEGMECPGCAMKIENTLSKLNGVESVKVDLGTDTASIKFDKNALDLDSIKSEIYGLGYKAIEPGLDIDEAIIEKEKKLILKKFKIKILVSIILSVLIVVLGMKDHISFLDKISMEAANWISLPLSTIVVFWCGMKFLRGFWAAMKNRTADMDTLIAIGTLSAYLYSAVVMVFPHISGDTGHSVYFESAAMIITFILIGNYLEANLKNKTQYAIKSLTNLQSKNATVIKNGNEYEIPIKNVKQNDIVVVKPGERIPVDGSVTEGISAVDESMVTGESIPSEKANGKKVIGGTMNLDGYLKIKTEKVGKETFLSKIINLVKDAQKSKPKIQRIADKVSAVFVPIVIVIAVGTFAVWNFLIEEGFAYSLLKAVAVLIIACPCALGLATPIAIVLGVGRAAENKILFNNAEAIENVNKVNTIVFDKTGTLTYAKFEVGRIHLTPTLSEGVGDSTTTASSKGEGDSKEKVVREKRQNNLEYEILKKAASIENYSEHPIARAIVEHYKKASKELKRAEDLYKIDEFKIVSGIGAEAKIGNNNYKIGGANLTLALSEGEGEKNDLRNIYLFENEKLIGEIEINDKVKDNAKEVIDKLKDNYELALVSGDNKFATERTAGELGIGNYYYQIMPDKKEEIISQMQREKKIVAMVGDGINDAPSLSKADLGIAIGTGQDIAIQSADVILVKGELENLLTLFKISNKTIRIIKQNIFWAFFYNAAAIPIAAGVLVPAGISVSPVMAAMLMAVSDIITVLGNSMRLKYVKLN